MAERILVGYAGNAPSDVALRGAMALAERAGAAIDVISVDVPWLPPASFGWTPPAIEHPRSALIEALDQAVEGLPVTAHKRLGDPAREIVTLAGEIGADLIALGASRHSGMDRILTGSAADRVLRLAPVPTLILVRDALPERILVAVDDSEYSREAVRRACWLGDMTGADLSCVHVLHHAPPEALVGADFDLEAHLAQVGEHVSGFVAAAAGRKLTSRVRAGEIVPEILADAAEARADLLVVGTHGRGFLTRALLGSVAAGVARRAPVSVMVAPVPAGES